MAMTALNAAAKKVFFGKVSKPMQKENLKNKKEEKGESKKCKKSEKKSWMEKC